MFVTYLFHSYLLGQHNVKCLYTIETVIADTELSTYTVSQKNRTPMICLNNSNKSNPILMVFGTKYRHIIVFYWHLLFCDTQ